jgi:thimet oligopeptidase
MVVEALRFGPGTRSNMKRAAASALCLVVLLAGALASPQQPVRAPSVPVPFFAGVRDEASLRQAFESHLARADTLLESIVRVTGRRTVENTLAPYDELWAELVTGQALAEIVAELHPDRGMRRTGESLQQSAAARLADVSLRPDLYRSINSVTAAGQDAATAWLRQRILREFRLAGVDQPDKTRARLKELRSELEAASREFDRSLRDGRRTIEVTRAELEGVPADFVATRSRDADVVTLSTDDVDLQPVLQYARSEPLRKRLQQERWRVAVPANVDTVRRIVALRHEIATLLGYRNWADYHAQTRMAGSAAAVSTFLDRVGDTARSKATREYADLLARKKEDDPSATLVNAWDRAYYTERILRTRYNVDSQEVRVFFPYDRVRDGIMDVAGRLFGISFRRANQLATWHSDVEAFEAFRGDTLIGRVYLDVHPRADKANMGAGTAPVRFGAAGRQIPELVLIAGVPGGREGDPGLLSPGQVRTLFHEFGHIVHALVAGSGRWQRQGAFEIELDAVEVPSTLFEEFTLDPRTLSTFARHHVTGGPIPVALVERMRQAGAFGRGLDADRLAFMSRVSLNLHIRDPKGIDPVLVANDAARGSVLHWGEGTLVAQFTHLANETYTSSYYTYLWSRVIESDVFSRFDQSNLFAPEVARRYHDTILVPGSSKRAAELFGSFLGRPFGYASYAAWLNGGVPASN